MKNTREGIINEKQMRLKKMSNNRENLRKQLFIIEKRYKKMEEKGMNVAKKVMSANSPLSKSQRETKLLQIRVNFVKKLSNEHDKEQAKLTQMMNAVNQTQKLLNKQSENIEKKIQQVQKLNAKRRLEIPISDGPDEFIIVNGAYKLKNRELNKYPYKNEYMKFYKDHKLSKSSKRGEELWRKVQSKSIYGGINQKLNVRHKQQARLTKAKEDFNRSTANINRLLT